jgi:hypothetical protein
MKDISGVIMSRMQLLRTTKRIVETLEGYGSEVNDKFAFNSITKKNHLMNQGRDALGASAEMCSPRTLMASGFFKITEQLQDPRVVGDERKKLFNLVAWYLVYKLADELIGLLAQRASLVEIDAKYLHILGQLDSSLSYTGVHSRLRPYLTDAQDLLQRFGNHLALLKRLEGQSAGAHFASAAPATTDAGFTVERHSAGVGAAAVSDEVPDNWALVLYTPTDLNTYRGELSLELACKLFAVSEIQIKESGSKQELEELKACIDEQYALLRRRYHPDKGGTAEGFTNLESLHYTVMTAINERLRKVNPADLTHLQAAVNEAEIAAEQLLTIKSRYQEATDVLPGVDKLDLFSQVLELSCRLSLDKQNENLATADRYLAQYRELLEQREAADHQFHEYDQSYDDLKSRIKHLYKECVTAAPEAPAHEVYQKGKQAWENMAGALDYIEDNLEVDLSALHAVMGKITERANALRAYQQRKAAQAHAAASVVSAAETVVAAPSAEAATTPAAGPQSAPIPRVAEEVGLRGFACCCLPWSFGRSLAVMPAETPSQC